MFNRKFTHMVSLNSLMGLIGLASTLMFGQSLAQPPAAMEPRHKNVFENNYLRILDVRIEPGDTTLFHRHFLPSAIVFFTTTKTGSQIRGGLPIPGQSAAGETVFAGFGEKPIVHRVWNQDTVLYHVMDIELISPGSLASAVQPDWPGLKLAWDEKNATAYKVNLVQNKRLPIFFEKVPALLICISGPDLQVTDTENKDRLKQLAPGKFIWVKPREKLIIKNQANADSKCILIVLK